MPKKILIHWVIIKEPNKYTESDGAIYILLESAEKSEINAFLGFFSYNTSGIEPRLFELSYNRNLHEKLQKEIIPKLKSGKPVMGRLSKEKKEGGSNGRKGKGGERQGEKNKGGGSESQEQRWEFHHLRPSEIHRKPE
jgi:hypothetical protein